MKNEPEIVKQLRQEEECGKLISSTIHTWEKEQTDESFNNTTSGTIQLFKKDIKHDSDRFDFDSISEKYQTIFENYAVAITIADAEERIISWNKYAEEIFNMNEKDLSMAHVSNLYPPEEWKRIRKENIRKKGMKYKLETKMIRKGHDPFDVEISLSVLRGSGGKITGSVAIIKDITKYKKTEKKLVESEDKYRTIFDNSAVAIMLTDENENIVSWNKYAETLLKFDKKDLYMKPVESLYPTEEWKKIRSENVRQKGMQHHLETKILQRNKKPLDVDISISVLKNREGKIIGSIGIIKDISERKEVEEKLEYEHDLLQSLLDNVPDSIVFKNREGKFIKVNNAKAIHYDAAPEDMLGKSDFDFLERDEAEKIYEDDQRILKTGKSIVNKVEKITDKKGRTHWISVTKTPRFNKCDEIIGTMGISRDITDIKQAEEELKKSEEKYHNLFDESADLIILIDDKGKFLDVNKKFIEESGYKKEEILGKYFLSCNIVTKESEIKIKKNLEKLLSGESYPIFEIEGVKKSGKIIPYEIRAVPIEQNSKIIGIQATLRNITDRKKAQEKYERLFNTSPDLIAEIDEDGVFVAVNATMAKSIGLPVEDVVGKKIFDVLPREIAEKRAVFGRQVIKKGEIKIVDDERNGIFFNNIFVPIYNPYGKNSVQVIARDVTLQKKAEQAILNSEKRYRELFEKAIDPIIILDDKGFFVDTQAGKQR